VTVKDYLKEKIGEALPDAQGLAANGRNLAKFRRDADDPEVDDDAVQWMLSFQGFDQKESYAPEAGGTVHPEGDPRDVLAFRLLLRLPDDEKLDADGYEQVSAILEHLRINALFQLDDGRNYEIDIPAGAATTEERYANDVFELMIFVG